MKLKLKLCAVILFALAAAPRLAANNPLTISGYVDVGSFSASGAGSTVTAAVDGPNGPSFYGTSYSGGDSSIGEVFEFQQLPDGSFIYVPLYSFTGQYGGGPAPYLINIGNQIFGTTGFYGGNNYGTMFSINLNGTGISAPINYDINSAYATSLTAGPDGNLYLSALHGGSSGTAELLKEHWNGTAWVVTPVHSFDIGGPPPRTVSIWNTFRFTQVHPAGVKSKNVTNGVTLYGVMTRGGTYGHGTVFAVNDDSSGFTNLYNFGASNYDGIAPVGGLTLSGNTLYGTTSEGGSNYSGTVFAINTDGSGYRVLKHFSAFAVDNVTSTYTNSDGESPQGDLIVSDNTLYGTTYDQGPNGGGTVFSLNTNGGNFTVLHSFASPQSDGMGNQTNRDGGYLQAGLLLAGNTLFGTTVLGGTNGGGVAFEYILPSPPSLNIARSGGQFAVSWPSAATNFILQQNVTLNSLTWSNFNGAVTDNGTNKSVNVFPAVSKTFFRLINTNRP